MIEAPAARFANLRLDTGPRRWPDSWFSFSLVLPLVPESFRAVAVDQRGFDDSDRPESGYAIPEMGADVIAILDALQIKRAMLELGLAPSGGDPGGGAAPYFNGSAFSPGRAYQK